MSNLQVFEVSTVKAGYDLRKTARRDARHQEFVMRKLIALAIGVAAACGSGFTFGDDLSRPVQGAADANRRADIADARQAESDLAARVAEQERANAALRDDLRRAD